jgi:hypothetical protein
VESLQAWLLTYVPIWGGASLWNWIVFIMMAHFFKGCIEQFAQSQAVYEDGLVLEREVERLTKNE